MIITVPVRKIKQFWEHCVENVRPVHLIMRGLHFLRVEGIALTFRRVRCYWKDRGRMQIPCADCGTEIATAEYCAYDSRYEQEIDFSHLATDLRPIAFFLPQFHTFPENDAWWGKGFTEWVNTKKAVPKFAGHYQPRTPHRDIGFYDLSRFETLEKQIALAKRHGVYAFCFYYYWFSGKKLMEKPMRMLLEHPQVDFHYCLCWANENFTRAWDGKDREVLMRQEYRKEDAGAFIRDIKPYCMDPRYVRIGNRPVIIVYNPGQIPRAEELFANWRAHAREQGIGEIVIWTCQTANHTAENLGILDAVDAEVEFPPHNMWWEAIGVRDLDIGQHSACIFHYHKLVETMLSIIRRERSKERKKPLYRGCMMGWDNAARRDDGWITYFAYSIRDFYRWVLEIGNDTRQRFPREERYFFVNAWNEWAEGTYLEPDETYGYANCNTFSRAVFQLDFETDDDSEIICKHRPNGGAQAEFETAGRIRIAVQVHLFYTELADEVIRSLNVIPYPFDCYISLTDESKKQEVEDTFRHSCRAAHVYAEVFENRGRDVAPFLMQMQACAAQYDYICHIHTKKTKTADYGDTWRRYLYRHLFGDSEHVRAVLELFETDPALGIVFPQTYPALKNMAGWGGNRARVKEILHGMEICIPPDPQPVFPVGDMFWLRAQAAEPIFACGFTQTDFEPEAGQDNATLAHAIERSWAYLVKGQGYTWRKVQNGRKTPMPGAQPHKKHRIAFFFHYDKEDRVCGEDLGYLEKVARFCGRVVFISNSKLGQEDQKAVRGYCSDLFLRENRGFDFSGWREAMLQIGWDTLASYDELYLMNNSVYGPVFDLSAIAEEMGQRQVDFWGMTKFPYLADGSYLGKPCIEEHLQSYFLEFNQNVVAAAAFRTFWEQVREARTITEVVADYESKLTPLLQKEGFSCDAYVQESGILCRQLESYRLVYEWPYQLLLAGMPFVKKKSFAYMDAQERMGVLRYLEWK